MSNRTKSPSSFPKIQNVSAGPGMRINVAWESGSRVGKRETVDLSPMIGTFKLYKPLESRDLFETVHIIEDGYVIAWGDDDNIDMPAETVERLAEETWTPEDFQRFLDDQQLTHAAAAAQLGRSRRQIENYLSGGQDIPRVVVLACYGLECRRTPPEEFSGWPTVLIKVIRSATVYD